MAGLRAADLGLVATLVVFCCGVNGFTAPTAVGKAATSVGSRSTSTSSPIQRASLPRTQTQGRSGRDSLALQAGGGEEDGIEEYKKQMAEFMAQAHEKRLQAMEAVKAEVQRGYEEQIADLQSKLAAMPGAAGGDGGGEPQLVGAGTGTSMGSTAGSGTSIGQQQHPGYAARSARPGWGSRWGSEESARASPTVSTGDTLSSESAVTATAPNGGGGAAHPAYVARAQRPGWEARWGGEEVSRPGGGVSVSAAKTHSPAGAAATAAAATSATHPAYTAREQRPGWEARWGDEEPARIEGEGVSVSATAGAQTNAHPAYAARARRPGWESRWGSEEPARMVASVTATPAVASTSVEPVAAERAQGEATATPADAHPAYTARAQRPGWGERWGSEEPGRMEAAATAATCTSGATATVAAPAEAHPAYAARAQRPGWASRWGPEEPARMAAAATVTPILGAPAAAAEAQIATAAQEEEEEESHPAYSARSGRPGWEARWGVEEKGRVESAAAGAVAVAGAAAGFATAGGLDAPAAGAGAGDAAVAAAASAEEDVDYLEDEFLPDDVGGLRRMVVSNRQHFQEYLLKSLKASNELRQSKAALEEQLSSSTAKLDAEQHLRESLQESFLDYMSRSGGALAAEKARIAELEKKVLMLATEADELKSFTQGYMVKASGEKQNAVEEAAAIARSQAAERIAALQAQVLELQAGA